MSYTMQSLIKIRIITLVHIQTLSDASVSDDFQLYEISILSFVELLHIFAQLFSKSSYTRLKNLLLGVTTSNTHI